MAEVIEGGEVVESRVLIKDFQLCPDEGGTANTARVSFTFDTVGRHRISHGDNTLGSVEVLEGVSAELRSCQVNTDRIRFGEDIPVQATVENTGAKKVRVRVRWFAEANGTRIGDVVQTPIWPDNQKTVEGAIPFTQSAWENMGRPSSLDVGRRLEHVERA